MANLLLLALLCLTLAGFACAAAWSRDEAGHARRWDAAFAFVLGAAALELVLLASPLSLMFPLPALLGLPLPMLVGPFWWRARHQRLHWSWRRWVFQLIPGAALLLSTVLTTLQGGWPPLELPSVGVVVTAALLNLAAGALRWPQRAGLLRKHWS